MFCQVYIWLILKHLDGVYYPCPNLANQFDFTKQQKTERKFIMSKTEVSSDFGKFMSRNSTAVQEAKEAENTMRTCAMPIGWQGKAVCVGGKADKSKDKKDEKGQTKEGSPYVILEFNVVDDEKYKGDNFSRLWFLSDTAKATAMDRFEWMLNEFENLGMPHELRADEDAGMEEFLNFFTEGDAVFSAEVVSNSYSRDGKEVKLSLTEAVDDSDSVMPSDNSSSSASEIEVGGEVSFMGKSWDVVSVDGDDLEIQSQKTGTTRTVSRSQLD